MSGGYLHYPVQEYGLKIHSLLIDLIIIMNLLNLVLKPSTVKKQRKTFMSVAELDYVCWFGKPGIMSSIPRLTTSPNTAQATSYDYCDVIEDFFNIIMLFVTKECFSFFNLILFIN